MPRPLLGALLGLLLVPATAAAQDDGSPPSVTAVVTGTEGNRGWYRSDVAVRWEITEPESADSLRFDGCAPRSITADTSGTVSLCTATSTGGTTTRQITIRRDTTPPAIACEPAYRRWFQGSARTPYRGRLTDTLSRPASAWVTATVDTRTVGPKTVELTGQDGAGNTATQVCRFVVERSGLLPREHCERTTVQLLDVRRERDRVVVAGVARTALAGHAVRIGAALPRRALGRTVSAPVGPDGAFAATLPLPARRRRARVVYEASLAGKRSTLALVRRVTVTSRVDTPAGVAVRGRVLGTRRPRTVTVLRRDGCAQSSTFTTVQTSRAGAFTVTLPRPQAPVRVVTYRLKAARRGSSAPLVLTG
jgi:hypothetical protein